MKKEKGDVDYPRYLQVLKETGLNDDRAY